MPKYTVNYEYSVSVSIEVNANSQEEASLVAADIPLRISASEPFSVTYAEVEKESVEETGDSGETEEDYTYRFSPD